MAAKEEYYQCVTSEGRKVHARGEITLPKEWRDKHDIVEGEDLVGVRELEDGSLKIVAPPE